MYDTSRMHIFESSLQRSSEKSGRSGIRTNQHLVEEVLDELLLQWTGCEESMEIRSEQLRHEVAVVLR
jgi:hypothetical protein